MTDLNKLLKPCKFAIEEDPVFKGFYLEDSKYWNGWLNPYVTKEVRDQILNFYCPPKVRDKLLEERKTCEDLDVFDNEYPWLEYWNQKADPKTGLYYFGSGFIWEEFEDKTYEVHWKEGYPKCDPQTVSLEKLKEDKEGRWNFSAYGEDVLDNISNLEINESLDVVGVTERTTFIRKE